MVMLRMAVGLLTPVPLTVTVVDGESGSLAGMMTVVVLAPVDVGLN
jgi:hypothetical protein